MIKDVLKGMVIGIANIIPGVSGGTMMVSIGIYDKLIYCITHLFSEFKKNIKFLLPIVVGMAIAVVGSFPAITVMSVVTGIIALAVGFVIAMKLGE